MKMKMLQQSQSDEGELNIHVKKRGEFFLYNSCIINDIVILFFTIDIVCRGSLFCYFLEFRSFAKIAKGGDC